MLQWVPGTKDEVIWNDREGDRFVARVLQVGTRELRTLQTQANMINNNRTMINSLANDTVEYSKKSPNPAIDQILESVGLKPGKTAPAVTTKSATK